MTNTKKRFPAILKTVATHQGRIGVALAAEDGREEVVDRNEGEPQQKDPQVVGRVFQHRIRHRKERHDFAAEDFTDRCDRHAEDEGECKRRVHPSVGGGFVLHADKARHDDIGPQGKPHRETHDGTDYRNVGSHGRHGFVRNKTAEHGDVGGVKKLLQDACEGQRNRKENDFVPKGTREHVQGLAGNERHRWSRQEING